jgi:hypothetical protein
MDYLSEAEKCSKILQQYVVETPDEWKLVKESDGMRVFSRPSNEMKGHVYKCETVLDAPVEKVLAAVDPTKPYRIQWDEFLEQLIVEKQIAEGVYLVYHGTKGMLKGLVSARDSLDVVTIGRKDGEYRYIAAAAVDHENYPPRPNSVRVHTYSNGYVIFPIDGSPDKCRFVMVLHSDMKMNSVIGFVADQVKPALLMQKTGNLRRGLQTLDIIF